ncbi:ANR family transcriptional regulator [Photobacterium damselae]|uniref:ANR family transcriptional regulator n=1 Tax=Photobacterium damselae TaxID=38293 RepID=UPI004068B79E
MRENDRYMAMAHKAAEAERSSDYYKAKRTWYKASEIATLGSSRHWALSRSEFCEIKLSKITRTK